MNFINKAVLLVLLVPCAVCANKGVRANREPITGSEARKDSVAERMLLYQRSNGGWPQPGGDAINYSKPLSETAKEKLLKEKHKLDTTIDDEATTREINYLISVYPETGNKAYLESAERGIEYLLKAQNKAGGWGQFFPDSSSYHKHITYNDQAMVDVLWVMKRTADRSNGYDILSESLTTPARKAVEAGISCILKTQYRQNGVLTVWCAQHDRNSLAPAKARAFELPSLSGNETVGIVRFLMSQPNPDKQIIASVNAAIAWLQKSALHGINLQVLKDADGKKTDIIVVPDAHSTLWARFYDLSTNIPFFTGRDSVPRSALAEIEIERRKGYAYYGKWPEKLLEKDYPVWKKKWNL